MRNLTRRLKSNFIRRRIVTAIIVFFVVYLLNFIIPRLEPGNLVSTIAKSSLGQAQKQEIIQLFGLNKPLWNQFVLYLQQTFLNFPPNYGFSFAKFPETVWQVVSIALPWTLILIITSQAIAAIGGILVGAWMAWHRGSKADSIMLAVSNFMWGVPSYWLAAIFIFVFAIKFHFFPAGLTSSQISNGNLFSQLTDILGHSFLPILTLVVILLPLNALVMRNTMVHVLEEDFMYAAEARGLKTRSLILGHAARNALLPTVTNIALSFGTVLSGAFLVEIIFSYPGMGYLILQSVFSRDYPVIQGIFFFSAILVIAANVLSDFAYVFLDPRVEY